jgi:hypothetical protein
MNFLYREFAFGPPAPGVALSVRPSLAGDSLSPIRPDIGLNRAKAYLR